MSLQPATASSPINISSDLRSPHAITISSDSSPHVSDAFRHHQTSYVTDRSIALGSPSLGPRLSSPAVDSHPSGVFSARVSHPANLSHPVIASRSAAVSRPVTTSRVAAPRSTISATHYHDYELKLEALREQCEVLRTENSELQGQVNALRYRFISLLHQCY